MALDRQDIEKKDFPINRRGYDPEAVDAHLARIADEIETIRRQAQRPSGDSLAQAASEQVRAIVEAAEQSAQSIERDARDEAARIRREAEAEAERAQQQAIERAQEHVARVGEQSSLMLQRVDAMENELQALVESLRTGGHRLTADLSLLEGNMGELYRAAGGGVSAEPAPPPEAAGAGPGAAAAATAVAEPAPVPPEDQLEPEEELGQQAAVEAPPAAAPAAEPGDEADDVEGARLIALNMALNGQPREETDRYLADNFDLADRQALLDEVYQSVGG